jgi:hypothetical protein
MLFIRGKIKEIRKIKERIYQVILQKRHRKKPVLVCLTCFGRTADRFSHQEFMEGDVIHCSIWIKSSFYFGKYYTDVVIDDVDMIKSRKEAVLRKIETRDNWNEQMFGNPAIKKYLDGA